MPPFFSTKDQYPVMEKSSDLNFTPTTLPTMPKAKRVLMVRPTYFHIDNPINPHMLDKNGKPHTLDKNKAMEQWNELLLTYKKIGLDVTVLDGVEGLPDMVFCANQTLPVCTRTGSLLLIKSNMANDLRHQEVDFIAEGLQRAAKYETIPLAKRSPDTKFEGMGDCLWLPGYRMLLGGYGSRTSKQMYERIAHLCEAPVVTLELTSPRFYHLDTCLAILNSTSALACREAFSPEGWKMLQKIFSTLIEVPVSEADSPQFACNAHCPDEKHVLLQAGSTHTETKLKNAGFIPIPLQTGEFIKSGGSVFCMKLMFF